MKYLKTREVYFFQSSNAIYRANVNVWKSSACLTGRISEREESHSFHGLPPLCLDPNRLFSKEELQRATAEKRRGEKKKLAHHSRKTRACAFSYSNIRP